jgi:hypothetical protein
MSSGAYFPDIAACDRYPFSVVARIARSLDGFRGGSKDMFMRRVTS